ncbi:MAG: SEC-C domain-containing protein [Acidobacteriota bacterium]|nr:SEC-C domain-containing protein [Acidobacteriota bacterium]
MATPSQLIANRGNALASTGPVTSEGKSRISRNAVTHGLFSSTDFVREDEREIYREFCASWESELDPAGPIEQTFAAEIVHAAWRLRRCSTLESALTENATDDERGQLSIDRARASAFRIYTRALSELRKIQTERRRADRPKQPATVFTKQTQSVAPAVAAHDIQIPRSAPCSCGSGLKFKRCCGKNAPPLLHLAA